MCDFHTPEFIQMKERTAVHDETEDEEFPTDFSTTKSFTTTKSCYLAMKMKMVR